jgi:hypothetical protein
MPQMGWINPASDTYQARKWAKRRHDGGGNQPGPGGGGSPTPDPGSQTDSVRVDPAVPNVAFVATSVPQPYGGSPLLLYPSSLVRPDPVNPGVAWLTVTQTGP